MLTYYFVFLYCISIINQSLVWKQTNIYPALSICNVKTVLQTLVKVNVVIINYKTNYLISVFSKTLHPSVADSVRESWQVNLCYYTNSFFDQKPFQKEKVQWLSITWNIVVIVQTIYPASSKWSDHCQIFWPKSSCSDFCNHQKHVILMLAQKSYYFSLSEKRDACMTPDYSNLKIWSIQENCRSRKTSQCIFSEFTLNWA